MILMTRIMLTACLIELFAIFNMFLLYLDFFA
jgi:hypothetical protein